MELEKLEALLNEAHRNGQMEYLHHSYYEGACHEFAIKCKHVDGPSAHTIIHLNNADRDFLVAMANAAPTIIRELKLLKEMQKSVYLQALKDAAKTCRKRFMGDLNREDMEARRCAEAIEKMEVPNNL